MDFDWPFKRRKKIIIRIDAERIIRKFFFKDILKWYQKSVISATSNPLCFSKPSSYTLSMGLRHPTSTSFKYAFEGIKTAFKREPNFRIHVLLAILVLILAGVLKFNIIEWLILAFTITFVITLELLNTVLEAVVNLTSPDISPEAKVAKDVSAGMVLVVSILAVVAGLVLFVPKILSYF